MTASVNPPAMIIASDAWFSTLVKLLSVGNAFGDRIENATPAWPEGTSSVRLAMVYERLDKPGPQIEPNPTMPDNQPRRRVNRVRR